MYNIGVTQNLIFVLYFPAGCMRISVVTVLMTGGELWVHDTFVTFMAYLGNVCCAFSRD